jgi:hypothetical protein
MLDEASTMKARAQSFPASSAMRVSNLCERGKRHRQKQHGAGS